MLVALKTGQEVLAEVEIIDLITNWEIFNTASSAFRQFQGMLGIIIITGIAVFKHNLGEALSRLREKEGVMPDKI